MPSKLNITVIGAGHGGKAMAAHLGLMGFPTVLFNRTAENVAAIKELGELQRAAQWRLDYVAAENSMGFHAPQEMARILGESIDLSRQAQVKALALLGGKSPAGPPAQ